MSQPLVLFDGVCNLCNGAVRFLVPRDRTGLLRFAHIQSATGQAVLRQHGLSITDWDSFVFVEDGRAYVKSAAAFRIARFLRRPWPLLRLFRCLPRPMTDWLYDRVARNRYALFGKRDQCLVPSEELRGRFIE
jgi:predicted DCC family thiol-disulfide oxidoreductase YuxK